MNHSLTPPTRPVSFDDDENIDWRAMIMAVRERLWLMIVLPVIGGILAWAYVQQTRTVYQSTATLEVEDKNKVVEVQEVATSDMNDKATMNTVAATVTSHTFLENVNERERFHEKPGFFPGAADGAKFTPEQAIRMLASSVKATPRPETRLLDISATHADPDLARQIAQSIAEGVIRFGLAQRAQASSLANDFLVQEAEKLRGSLEQSELALQQYRDEKNAISLEDNQNLVVTELNKINGELSNARSARIQMETDLSAIHALKDNTEKLLNLQSISSHPIISDLRATIAKKKSELAVLSNRYLEKHPKHIALTTELQQLQNQFSLALPEVTSQLESSLENARTSEQKLAAALVAQEKTALELERLAVQYNTRKRDVETNKTMYQTVLERIKEVDLTRGIESNNLKIHESATMGHVIWPSPSKIYVSAVGGGFCLAFGLSFLLHFMDRSIKTVDQAEKNLGIPVLAAVGLASKKKQTQPLEATGDPHGAIAESFRSLRVMASLLGREADRKIFLITSAVPSEGKTFCACNYAVTLSQQGLRTLLIDADLRKPRVSHTFFKESRKPGLSDYLVGKASLEEAAHASGSEGLMVMPAGSTAPNPAELLAGNGMKELLAEARLHYDRIVIDSAPVIAVSDTLLIAPFVETILQVVQWNRCPSPVVMRAIKLLGEAGKAPAGLILNQMPQNSKAYYYHYSPGYYGSKGVYGSPA